jgi:hypothetical protein
LRILAILIAVVLAAKSCLYILAYLHIRREQRLGLGDADLPDQAAKLRPILLLDSAVFAAAGILFPFSLLSGASYASRLGTAGAITLVIGTTASFVLKSRLKRTVRPPLAEDP